LIWYRWSLLTKCQASPSSPTWHCTIPQPCHREAQQLYTKAALSSIRNEWKAPMRLESACFMNWNRRMTPSSEHREVCCSHTKQSIFRSHQVFARTHLDVSMPRYSSAALANVRLNQNKPSFHCS
jgi:hypothetical protein